MTDSEIKVSLIRDIINGKLSLNETKARIEEYTAKYGKDFFPDYDWPAKDRSEWNKAYLDELELSSISAGLSSPQFILHLAEVSEYVYAQEKQKKLKRIIAAIIAAVIVIGVILVICIVSTNAAEASDILNENMIQFSPNILM